MQTNNFTKEQISNMRNIIRFMTRNKVCHLRKPIHNKKNTISYGVTPWGGLIFHESPRESRVKRWKGKGDEIHEHTHTKNPTNSRTQNTIHANNSRRWQLVQHNL